MSPNGSSSGWSAREWELRALEELASAFNERDRALALVSRAGFPAPLMPDFRTSYSFWTEVVAQARNGALQGGALRIVDEAAKLLPHNEVFAQYRAIVPHLPPDDRARRIVVIEAPAEQDEVQRENDRADVRSPKLEAFRELIEAARALTNAGYELVIENGRSEAPRVVIRPRPRQGEPTPPVHSDAGDEAPEGPASTGYLPMGLAIAFFLIGLLALWFASSSCS